MPICRLRAVPAAALVLSSVLAGQAGAVPVTITTPFINYENRAINSLGFTAGEYVRLGANSVVPNGAAGTTGVATTIDTGTHLLVSRTITFAPSPVIPNFYSRNVGLNPAQLGPWTLTFSNGADSAQAVVTLPASARIIPFVDTITLSGTSANPTFTWTPPPGVAVNGFRVNIFDKSLLNNNPANGPISNGQVTSRDLSPGVHIYTVTAADFTVPGYAFALGKNYAIEISVLQTKDNTTNTNNSNLQSVSRVYADFTPTPSGGPVVNLPVLLPGGAYQFNMSVVPGQTYYIDPEVAVGYDYAIGAGNPNFASVVLPVGIGDGLYDVYGYDGGGHAVLLADDLAGGVLFSFGGGGVERFRVTGIETSAGLDPANTTAFVTGLTFTGSGNFTGTQTPITAAVPEPPVPLLMALGVGLLALRQRALR